MKAIAGVFLLAATGMAQALLAPVGDQRSTSAPVAGVAIYRPMTASERWKQYAHDNFLGSGALLRSMKTAAFEEVSRRPVEWPSTSMGMAQRFGSSFARNAIQGSISDGMAAVLRHDTRYLLCNCVGTAARVRYALQMSVLTRNEHGRKVIDVSKFAGIFGGAAIMMTWRPHQSSEPVASLRLTGFGIGTGVLTNIVREFSPELKQMLRRHQPAWASAPNAPSSVSGQPADADGITTTALRK